MPAGAGDTSIDASGYKVGDLVDCLDSVKKWLEAKIIKIDEEKGLFINFVGWSDRWNEWIPINSDRIAPYRMHTQGSTAPISNQSAFQLTGANLDKHRESLTKLAPILELIESQPTLPQLSEEQITTLTTELGNVVNNALNAVIDDALLVVEVFHLFIKTLQISCRILAADPESPKLANFAIESSFRILNADAHSDKRFYTKYGSGAPETNDFDFTEGNWAIRPPTVGSGDALKATSFYLIACLNAFGDANGFELIAKRISSCKDSFGLIALQLCILNGNVGALRSDKIRAIQQKVQLGTGLHQKLRALTEPELKALSKDAMRAAMDNVRLLFRLRGDNPLDTSQLVETLNLELLLRLLRSSVLERQIYGVTELHDLMKRVHRYESELVKYQLAQQQRAEAPAEPAEGVAPAGASAAAADKPLTPPEPCWLTADALCHWILEQKVISALIGPSAHEALVHRSSPVLRFLASHGHLTDAMVNELWQSGQGKHEQHVRIVYQTVGDLASDLSPSTLVMLYDRVIAVPPSEWTDFYLSFVKEFTANAVKSCSKSVHVELAASLPDDKRAFGLPLLWQLCQDGSQLPAELLDICLSLLADLLNSVAFEPYRQPYLNLCIESIRSHRAQLPAFNLAKALLSRPQQSAAASVAAGSLKRNGQLVLDLNQSLEGKLLDIIIDDVEHYHRQAMPLRESEVIIIQGKPHGVHVSTRLDFIDFVLLSARNDIQLSKTLLDRLWVCLVAQPIQDADKDKLWKWATRVSTDSTGFQHDTIVFMFDELMCNPEKIDLTKVSKPGFFFYEALFVYNNQYTQTLLRDQGGLRVTDFASLTGLSTMWAMALTAVDSSVMELSRNMLVNLHLWIHSRNGKEKRIATLDLFMNEFAHRAVAGAVHFRHLQDPAKNPAHQQRQPMSSEFSNNIPLFTKYLCQLLHVVEHFLHEGDQHMLKERARLRADRNTKPQDEADLEELARHCKFSLANRPEYFQPIFGLLNLGGEVAQSAWRLLTVKLQFNRAMQQSLEAISDDESSSLQWATLIPTNSLPSMLYALQMVQSIGLPQDSVDREESIGWLTSFIQRGGLAHLCTTLRSIDLRTSLADQLSQQAVEALVKIIYMSTFHATHSLAALDLLSSSGIDLVQLVSTLTQLWNGVISTQEESLPLLRYDSQIVFYVAHLIATVVSVKPAANEILLQAQWRNILLLGLLDHPASQQRDTISVGLQTVSTIKGVEPSVGAVLLPQMLTILGDLDPQRYGTRCSQFFDLLIRLLIGYSKSVADLDVSSLLLRMAGRLRSYEFIEQRPSETDSVLVGLLNTCAQLVLLAPGSRSQLIDLIPFVFKALFQLPTAETRNESLPRIKSSAARKAAFTLLQSLASNDDKITNQLVEMNAPLHEDAVSDWDFEMKTEEKSSSGYAGMRNLGCICYMNALMQQIFMIPDLRRSLLSIDTSSLSDEEKRDSVLYQLQWILSYLQETERHHCDPTGFCKSFKDWDGNPINVSIQEDSAGFLSRLFDKIDETVKNTPDEQCIRRVVGGKLQNQFIGKCQHCRSRDEDFYTLTVNVKNKKNLEESLREFVADEVLDGGNALKCDQCNAKVDTVKRLVIKELPNTLVIVLKRFEMDYETMEALKCNDRIEFPHRLNMRPFTTDSIPLQAADDGKSSQQQLPQSDKPDEAFEYTFRGAVVHIGSVQGGHYYSYIQERASEEELKAGAQGRWFEFNDSRVTPLQGADIPDLCYGGPDHRYSASMYGQDANKSHNAYILFYDRSQISAPLLNSEGESLAYQFSNIAPDTPAPQRVRAPVPKHIFDKIWAENEMMYRGRVTFDPSYWEFLERLVFDSPCLASIRSASSGADTDSDVEEAVAASMQSLKLSISPEAVKLVKFATMFVLQTLSHSRTKNRLAEWGSWLQLAYAASPEACDWLLETLASEGNSWLRDFLLFCPSSDVRKQVANVFILALKSQPDSVHAQNVIMRTLQLMPYLPKCTRKFAQWFRLLQSYASIGPAQAAFLASTNVLAALFDLWLHDDSPIDVAGLVRDSKGKRQRFDSTPDWSRLLQLVACLTDGQKNLAGVGAGEPLSAESR